MKIKQFIYLFLFTLILGSCTVTKRAVNSNEYATKSIINRHEIQDYMTIDDLRNEVLTPTPNDKVFVLETGKVYYYDSGSMLSDDGDLVIEQGSFHWIAVKNGEQTIDKAELNGDVLELSLENDGVPDVTIDLEPILHWEHDPSGIHSKYPHIGVNSNSSADYTITTEGVHDFNNGRIDLNNGGNSTFVGDDAGEDELAISNSRNVGIGKLAMKHSASKYTAVIGYGAALNSTGNAGVAIGFNSAEGGTIANSVFIGFDSGRYNTGSNNTAAGYEVLKNNGGSNCTAMGYRTLKNNTESFNTAFGHNSGIDNEGKYVLFIGYYAGAKNTKDFVIGNGTNAARNNTKDYLIATGINAGYFNDGIHSNFYGSITGEKSIGQYSNAFGSFNLRYNEGDYNLALGHNSFAHFANNIAGNVNFDNTDIDPATNQITIIAHSFGGVGTKFNLLYTQGTSSIGGYYDGSTNLFEVIDVNTIKLLSGDITSAGSGTGHTFTPQFKYEHTILVGHDLMPSHDNQATWGSNDITHSRQKGTQSYNYRLITSANETINLGNSQVDVNFANPVSLIVDTEMIERQGVEFTVRDVSGAGQVNNITITCENGETINGQPSLVINGNYHSITLSSDGTNLFIKSSYQP